MRSIDDFPIEQQQALYTNVLSRLKAGSEETFLREALNKPSAYKLRRYPSSQQQKPENNTPRAS